VLFAQPGNQAGLRKSAQPLTFTLVSPAMEKILYRGVNKKLDEHNGGKLLPKDIGKPFKSYANYGEVEYNDGSVYGESEANSVVMHQKDSSKYPTSGISTTPIIENAKSYAKHGGQNGYIYKIDTSLLESHAVTYFPVSKYATQPKIPGDQEIILVAKDNGALPIEIIIEKIEV